MPNRRRRASIQRSSVAVAPMPIESANAPMFVSISIAFGNGKRHSATSSPLEVKRYMDIVEVAERSGIPASTLRFYEEKGLIASVGRHGLRRVFAPQVLDRLALIALGRAAGFSLEEIGRMFAPDGRPRIDRGMLAAKADELDATIRKLDRKRTRLNSSHGYL